jgi:succinyl-CoA synthetase alpha subunit
MSILINKDTKVLVQGITGKEGSRAAEQMLSYKTKVLAGVTPGKGGEEVLGVPVFNSVKEALKAQPEINSTTIAVPAAFAKNAMLEAIENKIPLIHVLTEHIPIADTAYCFAKASSLGLRIVGPSSIGIINPSVAKIGSIGGSDPDFSFSKGKIGLISKSGGMTSEIALILKKAGLGVSSAIGIGGDLIIGSTFSDLLPLFEEDSETDGVALFGEVGGTYELQAAKLLEEGSFTKKLAVFISGLFAERLPADLALGHAGAIIEGSSTSRIAKIEVLRNAGAFVAQTPDQLPEFFK